jgi:hypothetical protein
LIELKGDKLEESFLEFSHLDEADDDDDAYVLRVFAEVDEDDLLREYEYLFVRDAFQEIPQIQAIVDVEKEPASRRNRDQTDFQSLYKEE